METWSLEDKTTFFEKIGENIPIGIRLIIQRDDLTESKKIEALALINEFHHEMNYVKKSLSLIVGAKFKVEEIYEYIKAVAKEKDKLISSEVAYCIKHAFEVVNQKSPIENEYSDINPSIYELFKELETDKDIIKIMGAESLNNLEGFILGYFYAITSNEIMMHGMRGLPDLQRINDWIKEGEETENWKEELERDYKETAVKEFFKRFRENVIDID